MTFENKVFFGGIASLLVCAVMIWWGIANDVTVWIPIGLWLIFLAFHNRVSRTIALSTLIGFLASGVFGVPLGLLLFVVSMVAFWHAWI